MHEENAPYEPDEDELSSYSPEPDPISAAVGSVGFMDRPVISECVETFKDSPVRRFPERFDRLYWEPEPLLVDVVQDGTPEMLEEERARKRVEFKTRWCAENDRRYVVIPESALDSPGELRALLSGETPAEVSEPRAAPAVKRPRGKVQRPKATV